MTATREMWVAMELGGSAVQMCSLETVAPQMSPTEETSAPRKRMRTETASNTTTAPDRAVFEVAPSVKLLRYVSYPNALGILPGEKGPIIGDALMHLSRYQGLLLRRPIDRGFLVDVNLQAVLIESGLDMIGVTAESACNVLLALPFGIPLEVAKALYELCFVRFHFRSVRLVSSQYISLWAMGETSTVESERNISVFAPTIVVDSGFSATTVVPYVDGKPVRSCIRRIDVGGKLLTNRLKEIISFSQLNVLQETWLVNHIKEKLCYVSLDFRSDLKSAEGRSSGVPCARYVMPSIAGIPPLGLPHQEALRKNINLDEAQLVSLRHELFVVAELLFSPSDIGIRQCGVAECVGVVCKAVANRLGGPWLHHALLQRVLLVGGSTRLRQFATRLENDLCSSSPDEAAVRVIMGDGNMNDDTREGASGHKVQSPSSSNEAGKKLSWFARGTLKLLNDSFHGSQSVLPQQLQKATCKEDAFCAACAHLL